jgi:hypothetical protein
VRQRQTLADGFACYLSELGLERRHKTKTLQDILNEDEDYSAESNGKATQANGKGTSRHDRVIVNSNNTALGRTAIYDH